MTYDIKYSWKSFKISMSDLHLWLKGTCPKYVGCSAGSEIIVHFSEEPEQMIKDRIQMHLDSMLEEVECVKVKKDEDRERAVRLAKVNVFNKYWDEMILAERKIVSGVALETSDLDDLVKKYIK